MITQYIIIDIYKPESFPIQHLKLDLSNRNNRFEFPTKYTNFGYFKCKRRLNRFISSVINTQHNQIQ